MKALLVPKNLSKFCLDYWLTLLCSALIIILPTLLWVFIKIPPDFQQGIVAKIMYIHVPSAVLSLGLFAFNGVMAFLYLVFRIKVAIPIIRAILPIGLMCTVIVLITGSIWGKPTWGTWWIWDARLTSELILAFLYLVIYLYDKNMRHLNNTPWVVAVLSTVGTLDLPIIHYSVVWWHTLHQGPSILALQKPTIAWSMLWPLLLMMLGLTCMSAAIIMLRLAVEINTKKS